MIKNITLKYGGLTSDVRFEGRTVGEVLANPNYQAILGFGGNVRALVDGVEQPPATEVVAGDVLYIEDKAACKA